MSDSNPLAGFRRRRPAPIGTPAPEEHAAAPAEGGLQPYKAFDSKDNVERLQVRRVLGPTHAPAYGYLLDISYDRDFGTNFVLFYSFGLIVQVRGRHLQNVVQSLILGTCQFIQEFHEEVHETPADDEPVVTSIEVVVKASADAMSEAEQGVVPPR
jgi:hypothetical protein